VPLTVERGVRLPSVAYDAVIEPGDLVHCDVGLSSPGLRTDTQRNAYVLRPGEDGAPAGLREAMRAANRMQDLTTAELLVGRTGNEVLAAARTAAAGDGIDPDVYSHPVGFRGHGAGPAVGKWDQQGVVPGAGDYAVHPDTVYALELAVRCPVPEWEGQCVRMAVEEGIAVTSGGVD
jgi:Xaa-Pro aminopeptidase